LGWRARDIENHFGRKPRVVNRIRFGRGRIRQMAEFIARLAQLEAYFARELRDADAGLITTRGARIDWRPRPQRPPDLAGLGPQNPIANQTAPKIVIVRRTRARKPVPPPRGTVPLPTTETHAPS